MNHSHAAVEVHSIDTNRRIVLDAQINVLADAEPEIASLREVLLPQFVFLNLQTALKDFLRFWTPNCDMDCDLLVSSDAE